MSANFVLLASVAACTLFVCAYGQQAPAAAPAPVKLQTTCLGCICEAASGCNRTLTCAGDVCGPFRITWAYWSDGGKPTLNGEPSTDSEAYSRCVNEPFCAARAVEGYMNKFGQDCNGDGVVDCKDYARIHRLGGHGCNNYLDAKYETAFNNCMNTFG